MYKIDEIAPRNVVKWEFVFWVTINNNIQAVKSCMSSEIRCSFSYTSYLDLLITVAAILKRDTLIAPYIGGSVA